MFSDTTKKALAAPLNREHVKCRDQAGRQMSYIEAWRVIDEANRIFGFDGWSSETTELKCVSERERKIGKAQRDGWSVSYIAKVRITVFAGGVTVTREGVGSGHGIDADLGLAHESAIKESESDSRKRALMTFGNPFGLALYDKTQTNVVDEVAERNTELTAQFIATVRERIRISDDAAELHTWWSSAEQIKARRDFELSNEEVTELKTFCISRLEQLKKKEA